MSTMKCSLVAAMSVAFAALSADASEQLSLNLYSFFGPNLAFSTDMKMVAVGGNNGTNDGSYTFPVEVYKRQTDNHFEKVNEVVDIGDSFGRGVGLSGDGKFLAVGNPEEGHNPETGIFNQRRPSFLTVYDLTTNTKLATLKSNNLDDFYGDSVAMNGDGTKMVVGAPDGGDTSGGTRYPGQLYIYHKNGDSYQLQQVITGKYDRGYIGTAVSMSTNGSRVSGYAYDALRGESRRPSGATSVFEYDAATGTYTQLGSDILGNEGDGLDGVSFGLSGDGNTLATGYFNDIRSEAVIYKYQEGDWKEHSVIPLGKVQTTYDEYSRDGYAGYVKLNEDGNTAYVGKNETFSFSAFNWNGKSWIENLAPATGTASPTGTPSPTSTASATGSASYLWVIFACAQILSGWN